MAAGDWRDYAIDSLPDAVAFNVYRRTSEAPLYRIEKRPAPGAQAGRLRRLQCRRPDPETRPRPGGRCWLCLTRRNSTSSRIGRWRRWF
ncbi:MAG: DUF2794 domain-containing protein [Asticcacaulis sp.]